MTRSCHRVREHILDFDDDFERELGRKRKSPKPSESSSNSEAEYEFEEEEPTARVGEVVQDMVADNRTIKELSASGLDNAAPEGNFVKKHVHLSNIYSMQLTN
ncbi:hypothetical protein ACFX13_035356 [Malus domestica]